MIASQHAALLDATVSVWRPTPKLPTPDWCASRVQLSKQWEASPGPYNLDGNPFWREVLACFDDPEVSRITVLKSTQVGGTITSIAALLSRCELDPAPALFCVPNRDACVELRDRVYDTALASPALRGRVPPRRMWNTRHVDLATMRCYLAYSGAPQRLRGRPCKYVFLSETDVYQFTNRTGNPLVAAAERIKRFPNAKIIDESTPVGEESPIASLYDRSDQRRWHCPCPNCGHWQVLRFFPHPNGPFVGNGGVAGLTDANGEWLDPAEARKTAHYVCERGCKVPAEMKQAMVAAGRWVPHGCTVDRDGEISGSPARNPRHTGFHLWALMAETVSIGDVAAKYLELRAEGNLVHFWQDWLGLRYVAGKRLPHWAKLGNRLAYSHPRGVAPAEAWFLTAGADVQDDRVHYVIRGWAPGRTSWLVDWGILYRKSDEEVEQIQDSEETESVTPLASDLVQLDKTIVERRIPIHGGGENPLGRRELRVKMLCVDSNHRSHEVHDWGRRHDADRVRLVRGDHQVSPREKFRRSIVEKNSRTGKPYEGGMEQWGVFVNGFKTDMLDRLAAPRGDGAFYFTADVVQFGALYLKQLTNEPKVEVIDRRGRKRYEFKVRSPQVGVDFWDCEVYGSAAADMVVGDLGWTASAWEAWRDKARRTGRRPKAKAHDLAVR